jgi:hypothetical protein
MEQANFSIIYYGEFDPGSERTLAAWIRHASRAVDIEACFDIESGERVRNTWVTCRKVWNSFGKLEVMPDVIVPRCGTV